MKRVNLPVADHSFPRIEDKFTEVTTRLNDYRYLSIVADEEGAASEFAKHYVDNISRKKADYAGLVWLDASTEEALVTSVRIAANKLKRDIPELNKLDIAKANWFTLLKILKQYVKQADKPWLFIFDKLSIPNIADYLAKSPENMQSLVTLGHRQRRLVISWPAPVKIVFDIEKAIDFLTEGNLDEQAVAKEIIQKLPTSLLALREVKRTAISHDISLQKIADKLPNGVQPEAVLDALIDISLTHLEQENKPLSLAALTILKLGAFLSGEKIPLVLVKDWLQSKAITENWDNIKNYMLDKGLMTDINDEHIIMPASLRTYFHKNYGTSEHLTKVAHLLNDCFKWTRANYRKQPSLEDFALFEQAKAFADTYKAQMDLFQMLNLLNTVGRFYYLQDNLQQAYTYHSAAIALMKAKADKAYQWIVVDDVLEFDNQQTQDLAKLTDSEIALISLYASECLHNAGSTYERLSLHVEDKELDKAITYLKQAYNLQLALLDSTDSKVANLILYTYRNLGRAYQLRANMLSTEELYNNDIDNQIVIKVEEELREAECIFKELSDNQDFMTNIGIRQLVLMDLGFTYKLLEDRKPINERDYQNALEKFNEALDTFKSSQRYAENRDKNQAVTLLYKAEVFMAQQQWDKAEASIIGADNLNARHFQAKSSISEARIHRHLATCAFRTGYYGLAKQLAEKALEVNAKHYTSGHYYLTYLLNLQKQINAKLITVNITETVLALPNQPLKSLLALQETQARLEHKLRVNTLQNDLHFDLAETYHQLGDSAQDNKLKTEIYQKAINHYKSYFKHLSFQNTVIKQLRQCQFAMVYYKVGQHEQALKMYQVLLPEMVPETYSTSKPWFNAAILQQLSHPVAIEDFSLPRVYTDKQQFFCINLKNQLLNALNEQMELINEKNPHMGKGKVAADIGVAFFKLLPQQVSVSVMKVEIAIDTSGPDRFADCVKKIVQEKIQADREYKASKIIQGEQKIHQYIDAGIDNLVWNYRAQLEVLGKSDLIQLAGWLTKGFITALAANKIAVQWPLADCFMKSIIENSDKGKLTHKLRQPDKAPCHKWRAKGLFQNSGVKIYSGEQLYFFTRHDKAYDKHKKYGFREAQTEHEAAIKELGYDKYNSIEEAGDKLNAYQAQNDRTKCSIM